MVRAAMPRPSNSIAASLVLASSFACKAEPPEPTHEQPPALAPEPEPEPESAGPSTDEAAAVQRARGMIQAFASELQTTLLAAIEAGGPSSAIAVCKVEAPAITAKQAEDGWTLARTALKLRNPDNAATAWQRAVLDDWQAQIAARIAAGEVPDVAALDWREVIETDAGPQLRYMKAIPLGGVCLGCHGPAEQITPEVRAALAEAYPDDQAVGFEVGQLRGAFVVTGPLG
jgi:hypothetical protein